MAKLTFIVKFKRLFIQELKPSSNVNVNALEYMHNTRTVVCLNKVTMV